MYCCWCNTSHVCACTVCRANGIRVLMSDLKLTPLSSFTRLSNPVFLKARHLFSRICTLMLKQIYNVLFWFFFFFGRKGQPHILCLSSTSPAFSHWLLLSLFQNSIRHNLSLHSRFVRVQNEGTGKSSWWMLNPEGGKNGKSPRRRAASMDNNSKFTKSRGRAAKKKVTTIKYIYILINILFYFIQIKRSGAIRQTLV